MDKKRITLNKNKETTISFLKEDNAYLKKENKKYNCMGYAFGIYSWLAPIDPYVEEPETFFEELKLGNSWKDYCWMDVIEESLEEGDYSNYFLVRVARQRILENFKGYIRQIKSFSSLKEDEYGIVFSYSDWDFHFGRYDNGILSHKMGEEMPCIVDSIDKIFGDKYDGRRYFFALKRDYKLY